MESFGGAEVQPRNSFTALLELSPIQATELLQSPGAGADFPPADLSGNVMDRHWTINQIPYSHTLNCPLPFPSNSTLIERAAKYSVFATGGGIHDSPYNFNGNALKLKSEPADSNSNPNLESQVSHPAFKCQIEKTAKRKEREKKGKGSVKKSKIAVKDDSGDGEKLPYVHVRARRGEATDSHSLAERARREKINARMKFLQELVPGCNKISSTALMLDQIINHVQNLQRQVEYLSMKVAAVDPRIDFNLDSLLAAGMSSDRQQGEEQWVFESLTHPDWVGEDDQCNLITPEHSLLSYDSSGNSASLNPIQQGMEPRNAS